MSKFVQSLVDWANARNIRVRTIVPGVASEITDGVRERTADLTTAIADLEAGQAAEVNVVPDAPVMHISGGGFFYLLPTSNDDEMLGLCSDRSLAEWRASRIVGQADKIGGRRSKVLSDIMLTQFQITAPPGAPETWDHLVIGGPMGVGVEVFSDGRVVLTKSGGTVATIDMAIAGSVTIEVATGQSVNIGGPGAVELPKWPQLKTAIDSMLDALVAAGAGQAFAGAGSAQAAWDLAKTAVPCLKAKGE